MGDGGAVGMGAPWEMAGGHGMQAEAWQIGTFGLLHGAVKPGHIVRNRGDELPWGFVIFFRRTAYVAVSGARRRLADILNGSISVILVSTSRMDPISLHMSFTAISPVKA